MTHYLQRLFDLSCSDCEELSATLYLAAVEKDSACSVGYARAHTAQSSCSDQPLPELAMLTRTSNWFHSFFIQAGMARHVIWSQVHIQKTKVFPLTPCSDKWASPCRRQMKDPGIFQVSSRGCTCRPCILHCLHQHTNRIYRLREFSSPNMKQKSWQSDKMQLPRSSLAISKQLETRTRPGILTKPGRLAHRLHRACLDE